MLNTIKKHWFIVLVGVLFVAATVYFAYDMTKGFLPGKNVSGKDVVFEINGQNVTADDLYERLFDDLGNSALYTLFERAVVAQSFTADKDMISQAKIQAESTIENFKSYYGETAYEAVLLQAIKGVGYSSIDDLDEYFLHLTMVESMTKAYFDTNMDKYLPEFVTAKKPRIARHILVKMDDPTKPTEVEQTRWDEVKNALAGGESFEDVAKRLSDDTASQPDSGLLGYVDSDTQFVPEFLAATLALGSGETSEWVRTTYGYHLIRVDSTDLAELKKQDGFYAALSSYYPKAVFEMIWENAETLNIDFKGNDDIKARLLNFMGIEEAE